MPSHICFANNASASVVADHVMSWCALASFTMAAVNVGAQLAKAPFRDRAGGPQRTVALLAITVLAVEAAFTAGALVDFEQLQHNGLGSATRHQDDGGGSSDNDEEGSDESSGNENVVPWKRNLCLAQGATFQWALHAMLLVFLWFQYTQYRRLVQREAPQESSIREPMVIAGIASLASAVTAGAALTGDIVPRSNFYSCWVDGPYYSGFYGLVGGGLLLANFWCFKSVRWLDQVHLTLGANTRPEARQLLRRYKVANLALLAGALYLIAVILISIQEPSSQALCFLVSFDVLLLPFLFALFAQGCTNCGRFSGSWLSNWCCTACSSNRNETGDGIGPANDSITESEGGRLRANPGSASDGSRWSGFTGVNDRDSYHSNYPDTTGLPGASQSSARSSAISSALSGHSGGNDGGNNGNGYTSQPPPPVNPLNAVLTHMTTRDHRSLGGRDALSAQYSEPLLSESRGSATDDEHDALSRGLPEASSRTASGTSDGEIGAPCVDMDESLP